MDYKQNRNSINVQKERLREIIGDLKKQGYSQKGICFKTNIEPWQLSEYKKTNGKINTIPNDFLELLRKEFNVNIDYIIFNSDEKFYTKGIKYDNFKKVIENWRTIEKGDKKYLHLTMDNNFYEFLLELDEYIQSEEKGIISLDDEMGKLKEMYAGTPDLREFVLIPRNNFINLLKNSKEEKKCFDEVIDLMDYIDYLDE